MPRSAACLPPTGESPPLTLPAYWEPDDLYTYPEIYQFLKMLDLVMASVRDGKDFQRCADQGVVFTCCPRSTGRRPTNL
jgi:hypothetical protein